MLCSISYHMFYFTIALLRSIARHVLQDDALSALMNGPIRKKFGNIIPENVTWGGQIFHFCKFFC